MNSENKTERIFKELRSQQRLVLYCLGSAQHPIRSEVGLQKLIFLCNNAAPEMFGDAFHFKHHKQGPYSAEINETLNVFKDEGLVKPSNSLTSEGKMVFNLIKINEQLREVVDDYNDFVSGLTDDEILTFVYIVDGKQRIESEEWDRLEENRIDIAVSLLEKEKVSFSKAVEIAGMNVDSFENELINRKIKWGST